jgi:hypothetical protein
MGRERETGLASVARVDALAERRPWRRLAVVYRYRAADGRTFSRAAFVDLRDWDFFACRR